MSAVESSWTRIEGWLRANAPDVIDQLNGPASREQLEQAAAAVGVLPDDYASLLGIRNGAFDPSGAAGVFEGWVLYSVAQALDVRDAMARVAAETRRAYPEADSRMRPAPGIRRTLWDDAWLPIAVAEGDARTLVLLDLGPDQPARRGQLLRYAVDEDPRVVAPSVSAWLERIAVSMEAGRVQVTRDDDLVYLDWEPYAS